MPHRPHRVLRTAGAFILSVPLLLTGTHAASATTKAGSEDARTLRTSDDLEEATDRYLFEYSLDEFEAVWDEKHNSSGDALRWTADDCSKSPDAPSGYRFDYACRRHDFGYRNYRIQHRLTEDNRKRIDDNFRKDMYTICDEYRGWAAQQECHRLADVYYYAVRRFGAQHPSKCRAGGNPNLWNPALISTERSATLFGRTFELRFHSGANCAWGKISNGSRGDSVWVDWSIDGGDTWKQLSVTRIPYGGRQVYTVAHNHSGYTMRACGKAGNRPDIACTGWW